MELINSVLEQESSETAKERMKAVANTFLTHRQIGEAEAVYRLLPNMVLPMAVSRKNVRDVEEMETSNKGRN